MLRNTGNRAKNFITVNRCDLLEIMNHYCTLVTYINIVHQLYFNKVGYSDSRMNYSPTSKRNWISPPPSTEAPQKNWNLGKMLSFDGILLGSSRISFCLDTFFLTLSDAGGIEPQKPERLGSTNLLCINLASKMFFQWCPFTYGVQCWRSSGDHIHSHFHNHAGVH